MAFNCISLQLSSFVNIYLSLFFYIWDALGISGPPTGEKSLYKMHHPGPYKTSQWEGLANNLEESIYSILQGAPKMWNLHAPSPEVTGALGAASTCPAEGTPSSPPGSCIWRSGFEGQLNLFVIPNSSLFWDIHGYSGHLWTAYWGETSV